MKKLHKLILTAFFIAIAVLLPSVFHLFPGSGAIFLPMHIPVLLCGFICNPYYGAVCGIVSPVLSHLLTGMPAAAALPGMIFELTAYGALSGLFFIFFKKFTRLFKMTYFHFQMFFPKRLNIWVCFGYIARPVKIALVVLMPK